MIEVVVILGGTYAACIAALAWSAVSASQILGSILRYSGIACALWLTLAFAVLALLNTSCDGSILYGFHGCTDVSDQAAQPLAAFGIGSYLLCIVYGLLLLVTALIWEVVVRLRSDAP